MLERYLDAKDCVIADGAMGTELFARRLPLNAAPETWLIERPDEVRDVHRAFAAAGADVLLTNTFGANRTRLTRLGFDARVEELNRIGVAMARQAVRDAGRNAVVAGAVGPTGARVGSGRLDADAACVVFAEQMTALKAAGADIVWIETMYAAGECRAAVRAAIDCGLPYVVTASFGGDGRLVDGITAAELARELTSLPVPPLAIGTNCGEGPNQIIDLVRQMTATAANAITVAKANKGLPQQIDGRLQYPAHDMGDYALRARAAGARIIGGCCGTTAEDIVQMRRALSG